MAKIQGRNLLIRGHEPEAEESSYLSEDDNLFILPQFTFPHHYKVQEWLNENDLNDDFELVVTEIKSKRVHGASKTVSALVPQTEQIKFIWMLKGVEKLQQEILDFKIER